ncbi:MAG: diguanylate cyclase [Lachnospiraceae bacterium]|nr:diguanylate cyclase [Lachnospiraceae bacterium]
MKTSRLKLINVFLILYFAALAVFVGHIVFFTDLQGFFNAEKDAEKRDFSTDWTLDSGEGLDLDAVFAGNFGGEYSASKKLPDKMLETDSVYLSTSNLRFKVYVDDSLIYSYDTQENFTGLGDGVSYHMIGLGTKDEGATMRIKAETVFTDGHGGRINLIQYGPEELFRYYMTRSNLVPEGLSILMVIFGLIVIALCLALFRKSSIMRSLWALGLSAVLLGLWSLSDTGMPQLLTGTVYACREVIYGIPHLAVFPMIYFVYYITKTRRKIYLYLSFIISVACFGWLLFSRYYFGADIHTMTATVYFSYISELLMMVVILLDNEVYCRKKKMSSNMKYFYIGAAIFVVTSFTDIIRYIIGKKVSIGRGSWFRLGLVIFFVMMALQIYSWWVSEKTSLERDRFINRLLQCVTDTEDFESKLDKVLEYLCTELNADRAYIFEDNHDGTFDNTYEYCAAGVEPEIDNLKGLPYNGVIDVWYDEYKKGGHVLIYDMEKYREVSEKMYNILKPQGIRTLVTGPIMLEGEYIGFFGVDNPPPEMMKEISEIMKLLMFFMSSMISQRDGHRRLVDYSYHDALTGVGNRRAMRKFEMEELDTSRSYGFVMCDINGLKAVNDTGGHAAGDELIKTAATCLTDIFGHENVYRLGGDEFAVYTYYDSIQEFESRIEELRSMAGEKGVYVAIGYSYAEGGDPDYNARRAEADDRMYEEKRRFYRDEHDRRRRQ